MVTKEGTILTTFPSLAEQVLGLQPPFEDPAAMLSQAYTTLTGEQPDMPQLLAQNEILYNNTTGRIREIGLARALYEVEPNILEKSVVLNSLTHIFNEHGAAFGTALGALPLYHTIYAEHGGLDEPPAPGRKALLVGSISAVSSAAFVALSKNVFRAEPWIVDPVGGRFKERHGNFVLANGLALPDTWSGSIHTAVTNRLLPMLLDTDGQLATGTKTAERNATRTFAGEMFRLLRAGGRLLMCEHPPHLDMNDFGCEGADNRRLVAEFEDSVRTTLNEAGFSQVSVTVGREPGNSDFLFQPFDPSTPFALNVERPSTRAFYAQKPQG